MDEHELSERVLEKIEQLFAPEQRARVVAQLQNYGRAAHEREPNRVRLAILKLTDESGVASFDRHLATARTDYRDVLAAAEYPGQLRAGVLPPDSADHARLVQLDLTQYQRWLTSGRTKPR